MAKKNPDSSPASNIWERNYRDCATKLTFKTVMSKDYFYKIFSEERIKKYFEYHFFDEEKALTHYKINILISESFYPILSVTEIALRNSINREFIQYFGCLDWYNNFSKYPALNPLIDDIKTAINYLDHKRELITPGKIIAELTFGFWNKLFNSEYEMTLWKALRRAFPFCPKEKKEKTIYFSTIK